MEFLSSDSVILRGASVNKPAASVNLEGKCGIHEDGEQGQQACIKNSIAFRYNSSVIFFTHSDGRDGPQSLYY